MPRSVLFDGVVQFPDRFPVFLVDRALSKPDRTAWLWPGRGFVEHLPLYVPPFGVEAAFLTHFDVFERDVDGLFVALCAAGGTELAEALGIPTEGPYLEVDPDQGTAVERVYAAGDVTGGNRQVTVSVGEGADAAINLLVAFRGTDYVDHRKSTTE